jgi:hypothetical protein
VGLQLRGELAGQGDASFCVTGDERGKLIFHCK